MTNQEIRVDGSKGEGGGQIVRSSLALSVLTQTPIIIENIRAGRSKPGLMRQHLVAVNAAAEIGRAEVSGDELRSSELRFQPQAIVSGDFELQIGSAGSATLVLQTILPALLAADGPSTLTIHGGTHNPWAPCFDFLDACYLPLLRKMGVEVTAELRRAGFYPAGGGEIHLQIHPQPKLQGLSIMERGKLVSRWCKARVANLSFDIAQREVKRVSRLSGWPNKSFRALQVEANGPGNVLLIGLEYANVSEVVTAFGKQGVRAEQVARDAWKETETYLASSGAVGPHLADQLILLMALAAAQGSTGSFSTLPLTQHSLTHIELIQQFLAIDVQVECDDDETRLYFAPAQCAAP